MSRRKTETTNLNEAVESLHINADEPVKKPRGRPPKKPVEAPETAKLDAEPVTKVSAPKKVQTQVQTDLDAPKKISTDINAPKKVSMKVEEKVAPKKPAEVIISPQNMGERKYFLYFINVHGERGAVRMKVGTLVDDVKTYLVKLNESSPIDLRFYTAVKCYGGDADKIFDAWDRKFASTRDARGWYTVQRTDVDTFIKDIADDKHAIVPEGRAKLTKAELADRAKGLM